MSVMVNHEIVAERERGNVVIEPFRPEHLNTSSYDVTLGRFIARLRPMLGVVDVNHAWSRDHYEIIDLGEHGDLVLGAGERCLAHTQEFIGGRRVVTTEMRARSSWGRWGLQACACAGWGDVSYFNRWTAELLNLNPFAVRVSVGTVFAQIVFHKVSEPSQGSLYSETGQYQKGGDVSELERLWSPEQMLPKPLRTVR